METESLSAIKEVYGEFKLNLYERLSNPLMPSFLISWVVVNYKLLVTIFSEGRVETKFFYIDSTLYPSHLCFWLLWLIYPLLGALFYIFVLPYPARFVFGFSLSRKVELRQLKLKKENATLLTREESDQLRLDNFELRRAIEALRRESDDEISLLRGRLKQLDKSSVPPVDESTKATIGSPTVTAPVKLLSEEQIKVLDALVLAENNQITAADAVYLSNGLAMTITDTKSALDDLLKLNFVTSERGTGESGRYTDVFALTPVGRKSAKDNRAIGDVESSETSRHEDKLKNSISMEHFNALQALSDLENKNAKLHDAAELATLLNVQVTDLQIVLEELLHFDYVICGPGQVYQLTNEGRKALIYFRKKIEEIRSMDK